MQSPHNNALRRTMDGAFSIGIVLKSMSSSKKHIDGCPKSRLGCSSGLCLFAHFRVGLASSSSGPKLGCPLPVAPSSFQNSRSHRQKPLDRTKSKMTAPIRSHDSKPRGIPKAQPRRTRSPMSIGWRRVVLSNSIRVIFIAPLPHRGLVIASHCRPVTNAVGG